MKKERKMITAVLSVVTFLIIWHIAALLYDNERLFPTPIAVLEKVWDLRETLFLVHLPATLKVVVLGIVISVILGVFIAVIMDLSQTVEYMLYPTITVLHMIPTMCVAPLFVLWFGYGMASRLIVVILSLFFSVTVNTFDGFKSAKNEMVELLNTYGASRFEIFIKVKIPAALPNFFSSMKMSVPWSLVGVAVAEWLGATEGLGYYSKRMVNKLDGPAVLSPIVIMAVIALLGMGIVQILDKRIVKWRGEL